MIPFEELCKLDEHFARAAIINMKIRRLTDRQDMCPCCDLLWLKQSTFAMLWFLSLRLSDFSVVNVNLLKIIMIKHTNIDLKKSAVRVQQQPIQYLYTPVPVPGTLSGF